MADVFIRVSPDLKKRIMRQAMYQGMSQQRMLEECITGFIQSCEQYQHGRFLEQQKAKLLCPSTTTTTTGKVLHLKNGTRNRSTSRS